MTITADRPVATDDEFDEHGELRRSVDPYDPRTTGANFDVQGWLATLDAKLLATSEGRKVLTRLDPFLFAYVYLRKHMRNAEGEITFADAHFLWVRLARRWIGPARGPREGRRALVAPRSCAKSTWWFLFLPMWGGVHEHVRFAAAFADSGTQAELHLATFKQEIASNVLLMNDYPEFCAPARRHTGRTVADNQNMLHSKSGFTFAAKGIDSTSLGMKMGEVRPDLLICDDIEPPEASYSPFQREKRLSTLQNAIMPLNEMAKSVVVVGTVTMPGSIVHELVRHAKSEDVDQWVDDERFKTYHTRAIVTRPDGTRRSVWPGKWSLEYLESIEHTRSYKLNYDNDPKGRQGDYWNTEDIHYGIPPNITKYFLFVDPPVTMKTRSDFCGVTLVGYAPGTAKSTLTALDVKTYGRTYLSEAMLPSEVKPGMASRLPRVCILDAWNVKLTGSPLRDFLLARIQDEPRISFVLIENNQGGSLWNEILHDLPIRLRTYPSTESKEVRFARALDLCQKNRVEFAKVIPTLEDQLMGFPRIANDDLMDSACAGMLRLLIPKHSTRDGTINPR